MLFETADRKPSERRNVRHGAEGEGEIAVTELPAGAYAFATHVGPYDGFDRTYDGLVAALLADGRHEPGAGPCVEIYRNDPRSTPPAELVTDLGFPLRSQRS